MAFVILGAIFGEDETENQGVSTVTVTQPAQPAETETTSEPVETMADAREAADDDRYAEAIAIASALGSSEEANIRRRIANRIARRVQAALSDLNLDRAKRLIARAGEFPTTTLTRQARSSYRAASAAQQAAEPPEPEPTPEPEAAGDCDPNYSGCVPSYPPDVNCPEVDGPVEVTGSDPHGLDRDGDGIGCDS